MPQPKSAAQALYPHLPSAQRSALKQREQRLAAALHPALSPEAKPNEATRQRRRRATIENFVQRGGVDELRRVGRLFSVAM
jgi:hypothetical protein